MFQTYTTADQSLKQSKDGQKTQEFPTFCYNLNNIKMIAAPNSQGSTVNLAQLSDDNKTIQYIAQPFHPSYGQSYALVNPMQLGQNGVANITVDGRQIVVNKPLSAVSTIYPCICMQFFNKCLIIFRIQYQISASNVTYVV